MILTKKDMQLFRARSLGRSKSSQKELLKQMKRSKSIRQQALSKRKKSLQGDKGTLTNRDMEKAMPKKSRKENRDAVKRTLDLLKSQKGK